MKSIFKILKQHKICTLMILSNLGKPTWISIPCDKKLLFFTFCSVKQEFSKKFKSNHNIRDQLFHCYSGQILLHEKCYLFMRSTHLLIASKVSKQNNGRLIHEKEIKSLWPIFRSCFFISQLTSYFCGY